MVCAVAEPVLLHTMARLCVGDMQVFWFIAAPCPQLGFLFIYLFIERIMNSYFTEREKTLYRSTEAALDVLITLLAHHILWCKSQGADMHNTESSVLPLAPDTEPLEESLTPYHLCVGTSDCTALTLKPIYSFLQFDGEHNFLPWASSAGPLAFSPRGCSCIFFPSSTSCHTQSYSFGRIGNDF